MKANLKELCKQIKFDFKEIAKTKSSHDFIQSPEEEKDGKHTENQEQMRVCMALDEFYDVVFQVENSYIKGVSTVLIHRCPYFEAMFN